MEVRAQSGPAAVVGSGTTTTFFGHPLRLEIDLPDGAMVTELHLTPGPGPEQVATEAIPGGLRFQLSGFDGAADRGSRDPVLLGELGGHLVFLHFRISQHGESPDHTVHWTIFRAAKVDVGWEPLDAGHSPPTR